MVAETNTFCVSLILINLFRFCDRKRGYVNPFLFLGQIAEFCDRDLLYRMSDHERELVWRFREDCARALPNALNKLLLSFKWNNQKNIGQAQALLSAWPKISPIKALELLDFAYPDSTVRKYALECLRGLLCRLTTIQSQYIFFLFRETELPNEQLQNYLLQIVQALKHESYIYNDLVQFLLERAFENQRIGHRLFWLLRSEMRNHAVSVSYGLILEAYCRGAVDHIHASLLRATIQLLSNFRPFS